MDNIGIYWNIGFHNIFSWNIGFQNIFSWNILEYWFPKHFQPEYWFPKHFQLEYTGNRLQWKNEVLPRARGEGSWLARDCHSSIYSCSMFLQFTVAQCSSNVQFLNVWSTVAQCSSIRLSGGGGRGRDGSWLARFTVAQCSSIVHLLLNTAQRPSSGVPVNVAAQLFLY